MEVGEFLRVYAARAPRIMWFVGAGGSASAGVPTAGEMTWDFKRMICASIHGLSPTSLGSPDVGGPDDREARDRIQRHLDELARYPPQGAEDEYAVYFEAAFPDESDRRRYIESKVRSVSPAAGHLALATLLRRDHARVIWTTNFDRLIEDAAFRAFGTSASMTVATIQMADVARDALKEDRWPLLVKLHGDFQSRHLKNTSAELRRQETLLENSLVAACRRFGLAVVGYSGRDVSVIAALEQALEADEAFPHGLFWFHHGPGNPLPGVQRLLDRAEARGVETRLLRNDSFDELLKEVAVQFGDGPPVPGEVTDSPVGAALTSFASTAIINQVSALTSETAEAANADLERFQTAWREGRRLEARAWLDSLISSPARFAALSPPVAARVLRFAAGVALDEGDDPAKASDWVAEAQRLHPDGDDVRLRAVLLARSGDAEVALELLAASPSSAAQNLRAALLLEAGRLDNAEDVLTASQASRDSDVAEKQRLRALLRFSRRDIPGAMTAAEVARQRAPRALGVRFLSAALQYYEGLVPAAFPPAVPPWPQPVEPALVRGDAPSVEGFENAANAFAELMDLDLSAIERRRMETWRLAALTNVRSLRSIAVRFAKEVLARDSTQPYVLLWAAHHRFDLDLKPCFQALEVELARSLDMEHAGAFVAACVGSGQGTRAADLLDNWRPRFADAEQLRVWAVWRTQAALSLGDVKRVRALLHEVPEEAARVFQISLLAHEANETGDAAQLIAHLEGCAAATGDPRYLLDACERQAEAGQWSYVRDYIDNLLQNLPTAHVRRFAIYARYNTRDWVSCAALLDAAIASPDAGQDVNEFRRLRARVREQLGQIAGAVDDMRAVVAQAGDEPSTVDLMVLARLHYIAGHSHEVAACAGRLWRRGDLTSTDALMLAEAIAHDDMILARELWNLAVARGVADDAVPAAVSLGFKLGLDAELGALTRRMGALAAAGHGAVKQFTIDELLRQHREWLEERNRILEQYRRGESATHVVSEILNLPLVHLYHVVPAANETQSLLREQFALQLRDGGRGHPDPDVVVATPGKLAMDLSALLIAAHLDLLPLVESQFAPIQLPHSIMTGLHEQREKLKPHQPSQLEVNRQLLQAERLGWLRRWEGDLPTLDEDEREAAGNWSGWIALLERARRENAFVLDLPLQRESPYGRPVETAGPERVGRLITIDGLRSLLRAAGALRESKDPLQGAEETPSEAVPVLTLDQVPVGSVLYLTDAGAEAIASAGLLRPAAEHYALQVDSNDQDSRRAQLEKLPDLDNQVGWIHALIRRVSNGLADGRYELLPAMTNLAEEGGGDTSERPPAHERTDRLPLSLRFLADLFAQPPGTLDAIWIEDRWLNRHRFAGTARVTDVLEILTALVATGLLSSDQRSVLWLRLRAANVRILPLSAEEIVHHLLQAHVANGRVTETRALRVIRQAAAALVEDADTLHIPPPEAIASGHFGDLEVGRSYVSAVHDALLKVWRSAGDLEDSAERERVEAQSRWITQNLYIDLGLLRARMVHPGIPPEPGVSATAAAGLLASLIRLLPVSEVSGDDDSLATAYAHWVYDELIAARSNRDPQFRSAMLKCLRSYLTDHPVSGSEREARRTAARLLAGRMFDALPEPLRTELAVDDKLMAYIGRATVTSALLGEWTVAIADLANAGAAVARGETAQVSALGTKPPLTLTVSFAAPDAIEVKSPDGKDAVLARNPAFRALAADETARRAGLEAFRSSADMSVERWQDEVARLAALNDPVVLLTTLLGYQEESVSEGYRRMTERWRVHGRLSVDDLKPPAPTAILAHLRLPPDRSDIHAWRAAREKAAATLIEEEGPGEAFDRLAGLPLPLPEVALEYLRELAVEKRRALVGRLLRRTTSPVSLIQAIRLLALLGADEPLYLHLSRRLTRVVASAEWNTEVELLRVIALGAYEELEAKTEIDLTAAGRLIASWYHAHRFVKGVKAAGWDLQRLVKRLESLPHAIAGNIFNTGTDDHDAAHPVQLVPQRLALAGLQYASSNNKLLDGPGTPLTAIVERLTQPSSIGRWPKVELLRDMESVPNGLGSWLPPVIQPDGALLLGPAAIVPHALSADILRTQALAGLNADPFDPVPWLTLELVMGSRPLRGPHAEEFDAAIANVDTSALTQRLSSHARVVGARLALQALASGLPERCIRVREALLSAIGAGRQAPEQNEGTDLVDTTQPSEEGHDTLSETQLAALEGCYLLAQANMTRLGAMSAFANDLAAMGRLDIAFLRRARVILERFVRELALPEAHAFTSLLAESRGS